MCFIAAEMHGLNPSSKFFMHHVNDNVCETSVGSAYASVATYKKFMVMVLKKGSFMNSHRVNQLFLNLAISLCHKTC